MAASSDDPTVAAPERTLPLPHPGALVRGPRALAKGTVERADRLAHAPQELLRGAVNSTVTVNVDVDVNVASRATRAPEGADQAPARG
ncbi:MAG: hypothetical protein ACTHOE_16465 [Conexibacter sp.]